jgi:hypothetical protein
MAFVHCAHGRNEPKALVAPIRRTAGSTHVISSSEDFHGYPKLAICDFRVKCSPEICNPQRINRQSQTKPWILTQVRHQLR